MFRPRAALVALTAAASVGWWLGTARPPDPTGDALVSAVLDGDTIEVTWPEGEERKEGAEGEERDGAPRREVVRLLGVDTPETVHPRRPVECFGPEASAFTRQSLLGRAVRLRFDREPRDRYGRLLAFVEVGGRRFNDDLLAAGYARLLVIAPNGERGRAMLDLELRARAGGRGLWGAC